MESRLFETKLSGHKMFADLKDSITQSPSNKLRNLMELKDDVLYVWNPTEMCLMCLNLKYLEEHGDETPYQKLHPLSPPSFSVERVLCGACGTRVCVWGSRGVLVMELPPRWGRAGLFDSGKDSILCKSACVDERVTYCQGEVRRVLWHPASLSHLILLLSDNTVRFYNIAMKCGPVLLRSVSVGPRPAGQLAGRALLESLGDTAVDCALVPRSPPALLILRGNGDLYTLPCSLQLLSDGECKVSGPLCMFPPADDNYGSESCSVACVGGAAPLVVVATCAANIYHCLLLPHEEGGEALYVVEAVELEVCSEQQGEWYPVHLYPCSSESYACLHSAGVHVVTLPLLAELAALATADHAEEAVRRVVSARTNARHAVRTATTAPPLGLALTHRPLRDILTLTHTGHLIHRTLDPFELEQQLYKELQLANPALHTDQVDAILKQREKVSFSSIIQEVLRRDVSQPILSVAAHEHTYKQCLEMLTEATVKLRSEYMSRQQRAADATRDKLTALANLAVKHQQWMQLLQEEVCEARAQSEALREKCARADQLQRDLHQRCSGVLRRVRGGAALSACERALLAEVTRARQLAQQHAQHIHALREHTGDRTRQLCELSGESGAAGVAGGAGGVLGRSHSDTIAAILKQQTSQISTLIEETKLLKDQLSIV